MDRTIVIEDDDNKPHTKSCNHYNDQCGCYSALVDEKALLEYKLNKFNERQQIFLERLRLAIVETTTLSQDQLLIVELNKLDESIEKFMIDVAAQHNRPPTFSNNTTTTTTTTTSTVPTITIEDDTEAIEFNQSHRRVKRKNEATANGHSNNSNNNSNNNNEHASTEELDSIWRLEDEKLKQEKERIAQDDFEIAKSFQPRQCPMCLEDVEVDFISVLSQCNHEYCRDCLIHYITDKITSKSLPVNCPLPDCKKEISVYDFEILLDAKMLEKYNDFAFNNTIEMNPETFSCCPTADCGYVFIYEKGDSSDFNCPKCNKRYCLTCRADFHKGSTCEQYQQWLKENGQADQLFEQFAQGMKLKKCPKCNRWTEKISGCNHMSCKCGQQFCYHCGNSYPCQCGKDPHVAMNRYPYSILVFVVYYFRIFRKNLFIK